MKTTKTSDKPLGGVAGLFDESERKELFRRYLVFLGWIELLIFVGCWLYQLGTEGYDRYGSIEIPFPWKAYFLIAFLAPVAVTFLMGMVIVGFNRYFGGGERGEEPTEAPFLGDKSGGIYKLHTLVTWLQHVPFLGLLLLLGVSVAFFYNLDTILSFVTNVGEKSVKAILMAAAVLLGVASVFALILIVLNYQLRKKSMEYQYKSEVAERFGLIILDDNTVLNKEGNLLVQGKQWKEAVPLLPQVVETREEESLPSSATPITRIADQET